jgi:hypothetical protein
MMRRQSQLESEQMLALVVAGQRGGDLGRTLAAVGIAMGGQFVRIAFTGGTIADNR